MSPSPYRRPPRLKVSDSRHRVGDVITRGKTRWLIREINGQNVRLDAANSENAIIWRTTLDKLPTPTKEKNR